LKVVLGLGNEGPEYRFTRHNVGFLVADAIALRCGAAFAARGDLGRLTWTAETEYGGERVVLAKPKTLMNRSGQAASALRRKYGAEPGDFIVVFDDADLAFGRVRVRPDGGAGGHNGVRSLIETLGVGAFPRVKLGVLGEGRHSQELADYVLGPFHPDERPVVAAMVDRAADAVAAILEDGVDLAQRAYNGAPAQSPGA
jgi:peptidyl-tRNA hydrolase, PTH1 family